MNFNQKTIKKLLLIVGAILFVLLVLLGITLLAGRDNGDSDYVTRPPEEQITLIYWGLWEPESVMQPLIEKYEDENPHVRIKYDQKSGRDYENFLYTRLTQGMDDGSPVADIVKINNTWLPKYQPYLEPAPSNIMNRMEYTERFFPVCTEDFTDTEGNIYAIPIGIDALAVFYNKELLEEAGYTEPPIDWDSFIELGKQLTVRDINGSILQSGIAMGTTNNIIHSADIISALLQQNQAEIISNTQPLEVDLSSNNARDAFDFYKDFAEEYNIWSADLHNDLDMFFRGELAMLFAPSWRAFDIIEYGPQVEFGMAPMPQLVANEPVNYAMYWGEGVSKTSQHPEEAWKFLEFLSREENIRQFYSESAKIRAFGQPYPLQSLHSALDDDRYASAIMQMAPSMTAWPMSQYPRVEDKINEAINDHRAAEEGINRIFTELFSGPDL